MRNKCLLGTYTSSPVCLQCSVRSSNLRRGLAPAHHQAEDYKYSRGRSAGEFRSRSWPAQTQANSCFDLYQIFPLLSLINSWDSGGKETYEKATLPQSWYPSYFASRSIEQCDVP